MKKEEFELIRNLIKLEIRYAFSEIYGGSQLWEINNEISDLRDKCDA